MADIIEKTDKSVLTDAQIEKVTIDTGKLLAAQPKRTVRLHQTTPPDKPLPDETVCINGYIFQIKRGVDVQVPQSVYDVLEQAARL